MVKAVVKIVIKIWTKIAINFLRMITDYYLHCGKFLWAFAPKDFCKFANCNFVLLADCQFGGAGR
ncbi:hypothetical protein [Moraxella caviae]|uniref:hypothetical protein n=1 Tax=Moraxella caviae TaxID=34060 RepID=UPI0009929B84|nr:hypothetical protein [Moraxella caviae]